MCKHELGQGFNIARSEEYVWCVKCKKKWSKTEVERIINSVECSKTEQIIEQLADQEHERWSRWMRYLFDNWTDGNITRWKKQMVTPYAELPEHSKESDRKEARKTMEIVGPIIAQLEDSLDTLVVHSIRDIASGWVCVPESEWDNTLRGIFK